jgi:PAS domain S-box-containing protein
MKTLSPLYIVAVYFLVSLLWLVSSDYYIHWGSPEWAFLIEPLSDICYIVLTSLLLYLLIRSSNRRLQASDANYRDLFENNPQPMWVYDPVSLRFLAVNNAAVIHYGYSREEFLGMTKRDIRPVEDVPAFLEDLEEVAASPREVRLWRHRKKDGSVLYAESTSRSLAYGGKPAVLVLSQDVTERISASNRLRYHEELLKSVFDRIPIGIALAGPSGRFEEVNTAFCRIFEADTDRIIGTHFTSLLRPEDARTMAEAFNRRFASSDDPGAPWQELEISVPSGETRWILGKSAMIRDVHNNPRMATFVNDITESKRASREREAVLHELQNYKTILDKSALVSITDPEGHIVHANDLFCRVAQYSREELIGQNHRIINSGHHPRAFFRDMWQTIRGGKLWRGEIRNQAKDGSYYWVDTTINPVFDEKGKLIQYLSIRYDITQRKNSEERIIRSEAALREAQTLARIGNWEFQAADQAIHWSDEVFNIHGLDKEKGEPALPELEKLYHPDDLPLFRQILTDAISQGTPYNQDLRIVTPGGGVRHVNIIGKPEFDQAGRVVRLSGTIIDINERKLVERHLQTQNEELKKINEELDRFVYSAGHDLRAPLMSVLGLINIAQLDESGAKKDEYMELMRRSIHKLDEFIKDIIHFSRNARTPLTPKSIDFAGLLHEVVENLHYMKGARAIQTHLHVTQELPFFSDPKRLTVVLNNLLANAFRYSDPYKPQSFVDVTVTVDDQGATIRIEDNGIGIEREHLDKIFLMFYRATESRSGSGLGLYIVKETIETLQGHIRVQSRIGEGTSFSIRLPNLHADHPADPAPQAETVLS